MRDRTWRPSASPRQSSTVRSRDRGAGDCAESPNTNRLTPLWWSTSPNAALREALQGRFRRMPCMLGRITEITAWPSAVLTSDLRLPKETRVTDRLQLRGTVPAPDPTRGGRPRNSRRPVRQPPTRQPYGLHSGGYGANAGTAAAVTQSILNSVTQSTHSTSSASVSTEPSPMHDGPPAGTATA